MRGNKVTFWKETTQNTLCYCAALGCFLYINIHDCAIKIVNQWILGIIIYFFQYLPLSLTFKKNILLGNLCILEHVAQWGCGCPLPGSTQGKVQGCEQPALEGGIPAYRRGLNWMVLKVPSYPNHSMENLSIMKQQHTWTCISWKKAGGEDYGIRQKCQQPL